MTTKDKLLQQKFQEDSRTTTDSGSESDYSERGAYEPVTLLDKIAQKDKDISSIIHHLQTNSFILELLIYITGRLFNPDVLTCYFIILLSYNAYYFNDYYYIIKPLIHVLVIVIITVIMKHTIGRPRPHHIGTVKRRYNLRSKERNCSMPSGDSMQCSSFSIIFLFYMNCPYGFILIPLVMFSRIFYFCHFIMDTVIGTCLGLVVSYLLVLILRLF